MSIKGGDEKSHLFVPSEATELCLSFTDGGGDPAHDHFTVTPAAHIARELSDRTVEVFNRVGRSQRAVQCPTDRQPGHRQRFRQPLAQ